MSKSIKVSEEVYQELVKEQRPRETFNEEIERFLRVYKTLFNVVETLGPSHSLMQKPEKGE